VLWLRFADGGTLTNFYDTANRLNGVRLPSGLRLTNAYDFAGRLTNRQALNGAAPVETHGFAFNLNDAVTSFTDATGTTVNHYDTAGRYVGATQPSGAGARYELDLLGRITALTNRAASGGTAYITRYAYDALGRMTNVTDPWGGQTALEYDRVGRRTKRTLPNGVVSEWQYNWKDQVTNLLHRIGATPLASVGYLRAAGGEPTRINREDGTYVLLQYDAAWRLTNEVYHTAGGVVAETVGYAYDAGGTRVTRRNNSGTFTNAVVNGYQVTHVRRASDNAVMETYGYDQRDPRLQPGRSAHRVREHHLHVRRRRPPHPFRRGRDAAVPRGRHARHRPGIPAPGGRRGQRLAAGLRVRGRRTAVALRRLGRRQPDLLPRRRHGFGDRPGPADQPGHRQHQPAVLRRLRQRPLHCAAGDFRFHGLWLESATGLYHARARDYDPITGRFLSRDPETGTTHAVETHHAYSIANNNPHIYSDPSGRFTLIEISFTSLKQAGFQAFRTAAVQKGRKKVFETIGNIVKDELIDSVKQLMPVPDFLSSFQDGIKLGDILRETICKNLHVPDRLYFEVPIDSSGKPHGDGFTCGPQSTSNSGIRMAGLGVPRPDIIIGTRAPYDRGAYPKTWTIAEIKSSSATLYREYISHGDKSDQMWAVINYAKKHTFSRTALFITGVKGKNAPSDEVLIMELGRSAIPKGVIPMMLRIVD
jgi:RHS repeat-associated protein